MASPPSLAPTEVDSVAAVTAEAAAYLARLSKELEALETTQTALLHSHHATSAALADSPAYNAVAPTMDRLPEYIATAARLKALMTTQQAQVDRLLRRSEQARALKARNEARMRQRWGEERVRDKALAARVVSASTASTAAAEDITEAPHPSEASTPSIGITVAKVMVTRKKKARQAEIE
ncbi:hypothetical protein DRE_04878 [Drechslerella stenobrocha 248]|uniref:Uncharacterized protein n=1 Tax=Drechslerella stenobrocha 248 TaxID=1043628 RepID=W7HP51_9PEZI|nr:hypothetical protein DRE_04878 [Drechslerella stenobrocha 248]